MGEGEAGGGGGLISGADIRCGCQREILIVGRVGYFLDHVTFSIGKFHPEGAGMDQSFHDPVPMRMLCVRRLFTGCHPSV